MEGLNFGGDLQARVAEDVYPTAKSTRQRTVREQIDVQIIELESRLKELKRTKLMFDENPQFEMLLNQMRKIGLS